MTPQILSQGLSAYRIGDPAGVHPIFDATGSTINPGRWNDANHPMIYAAERYSTALLEKLVHGSGALPPNQHYVEISIPAGLSYEVFQPASYPRWDLANGKISRDFGCAWQASGRSVLLVVPSVVARLDNNILINPNHTDFPKIGTGLNIPVYWDSRLFP